MQQPKNDKQKPRTRLSDANWFPHDEDTTNDPKIGALLMDYGAAGYGVFWHINELLHAEPEGKLPLKRFVFAAIAGRLKVEVLYVEGFINKCLDEYELYTRDGDYFTSNRVKKNKAAKAESHELKKEIGRKGGEQRAKNAGQKPARGQAEVKHSLSRTKAEVNQTQQQYSTVQDISIDISVVLKDLNDSLKAEPSAERLERAFATGWPELSEEGRETLYRAFKAMPIEQQVEACQTLVLDLTSGYKGELSDYLEI